MTAERKKNFVAGDWLAGTDVHGEKRVSIRAGIGRAGAHAREFHALVKTTYTQA